MQIDINDRLDNLYKEVPLSKIRSVYKQNKKNLRINDFLTLGRTTELLLHVTDGYKAMCF